MVKLHQAGEIHGCRTLVFHCPGCGHAHVVYTGDCRVAWEWNGSMETPSFRPSLLVRGMTRCHSFVEDGRIRFLGDCEHDLAGQTVEIPDWEARDG